MVARGDLGVENPIEEVPVIQKRIIFKCNLKAVPVITATQMLESMVENATPTRAEVTDVANAIFDGTDAVMLSEETAVGKYPQECVRVLHRVALNAERASQGSDLGLLTLEAKMLPMFRVPPQSTWRAMLVLSSCLRLLRMAGWRQNSRASNRKRQ